MKGDGKIGGGRGKAPEKSHFDSSGKNDGNSKTNPENSKQNREKEQQQPTQRKFI